MTRIRCFVPGSGWFTNDCLKTGSLVYKEGVFPSVHSYHNVRGSRILNKIFGRASRATGIFNHGWHGLTRIRKPNPKSTNHRIGIRTIGQPEYWFYPDRIREIRGCDHETNYHNSESLFDRIRRFAVEGIGHGRVPRGATGKHDRSPDRPAAMKVNPIV